MPSLLDGVQFSSAYYDCNGNLMRLTLAADDKYRLFVPLENINPTLQQATVLYEDRWFRYHPGVNPVALMRAIGGYMRGRSNGGASTITMQVARMKYDMDTRRPAGKLKQIAAAIYIDAMYSKHDILEAYLNMAPYGGNIEGAGAAALIYFHTPVRDIGALESITLSTIPQNPSKRGLNTRAGMRNMAAMRKNLVRRWAARFKSAPVITDMTDMPLNTFTTADLPRTAPHFINREISRRRRWGDTGPRNREITTTLDARLQRHLERTLTAQIQSRRGIGVNNAAAVLLNYKTMQVLAHIGSADYNDKSIYGENDGVYARRSPGSTLKPLIYAAAVDRGLIHSMTLMKDTRVNFGVYAPENADNEFYGPVLARDALTHSRNIPAINLVRQMGVKSFYNLLRDCGVTGLRSPDYYGISVALGGAEVSMMELARIYATMANLGQIREIQTATDHADSAQVKQILSPEAFFITLDMLGRQHVPTDRPAFAKKQGGTLRHYWKTGTSSSYRDAWTAGIFGDFVLIVWVGNFDGRPNNSFSGARVAAPIYFALANSVERFYRSHGRVISDNNFLNPDMNISQIDMCDTVGGLAGTYCPRVVKTYFIPGVSPIETSSVYRSIPIDRATGRRACTRDPKTTYMATYEFWDSEYLDMFRRAGVQRNTPPPYVAECDLNEIASHNTAPQILSPADGTGIVIVSGADETDVALRAVTENPDARIFWMLDNEMLDTCKSGETLRARVAMGEHTLRAIDEMGAGRSITFTVIK